MPIRVFQITQAATVQLTSSAASLDELTRALPQGFYTTFATLANGTKVLGLRAHLQRLFVPAGERGLRPVVDELTLRVRIAALVKKNLPKESRVRLILAKDSGAIYLGLQYFEPLPGRVYSKGVHAVTTELARETPRLKDTGFIVSSERERRQVGRSVFEVLLTKNGRILEGMTSNFYGIAGKSLVTARQGILFGVTRQSILRLARGQGMSVDYRAARVEEELDESFLTSSSRGVVPIVSINEKPVGEGHVGRWTKILSKAYQDHVRANSENIL